MPLEYLVVATSETTRSRRIWGGSTPDANSARTPASPPRASARSRTPRGAVNDPIGQGFISSLARPGSNITGFTGQFAQLLRSYRIYRVAGDGFGGEFCREPLRKHSVSYEVVKQSKSELYGEHLLPMLNSGRVDLLDHPRAIQQIIGLECYPSRNRDKIDHGPGAHDDLANCIAGAVARVAGGGYRWDSGWLDGIGGDVVPKPDAPLTTSRRPFFNMPYISTG